MEGLESWGGGLILIILMRLVTTVLTRAVDLFLGAIVVEDTLQSHSVLGLFWTGSIDCKTILDRGVKVSWIGIESERLAGHGGSLGKVGGLVGHLLVCVVYML